MIIKTVLSHHLIINTHPIIGPVEVLRTARPGGSEVRVNLSFLVVVHNNHLLEII